ncbi:MAG TPA: DUF481 domain-containing protein [Acidobacteriaceae bacterium]
MKISFRLAVGLLAVLLSFSATAQKAAPPAAPAKPAPDVLIFTNGDQLTGTLVRAAAGKVVFKSDMAGEITVSLDKVRELRSTGSFAVLRKDVPVTRTSIQPGTIIFADGNITVANPAGWPEIVPVKQLSYLIDQATYDRDLERRPGPLFGWTGNIRGGATLVRSTTDGNTLNAGVALVRAIPTVPFLPARNRTTFDVQETYGKQTSPSNPQTDPSSNIVVKTNIFHADAERDEYFSTRFYALAQTTFDHNYAQGLNLQAVYGGGIGWTPIKTPKQELDVKADVHFETQQFLSLTEGAPPAATLDLVGSTFSQAYRRALPRKFVLTETANVLPAWNNTRAYSANGSVALAMPLFKRLGLQFATTDNFLNDPGPGFKKNSYQFVTGVTYSLH